LVCRIAYHPVNPVPPVKNDFLTLKLVISASTTRSQRTFRQDEQDSVSKPETAAGPASIR
jgi:hypothetical protein